MSTTANKYPFFDLSEIISDNDLTYKKYESLKPVKTGNFIPELNLDATYSRWQNFYNGAPTYGPIAVKQLFGKPLVIGFYSKHWKDRGLEQLRQLNALQYEVKASGGNLLVITAEEADGHLAKIAWEHNLSLNFYYDRDNAIAEKFRVFSENDPTWNRFAGIDENIPLLATYVVDTAKQIVYDHVDRNLTDTFIADDVLAAVYDSALGNNRRRSA